MTKKRERTLFHFECMRRKPGECVARLLSIAAFIVAASVLCGWYFNIVQLKSIFPDSIEMLPNTAIGFVLISSSLFLSACLDKNSASWKKWLAHGLAFGAALLGAATAYEYIFAIDLGIDEIVFSDLSTLYEFLRDPPLYHPFRMSIYAAFNFIFMGIAILVVDWELKNKVRPSQLLALITTIPAIQCLLVALYGINSSAILPINNYFVWQMAPVTAINWLLLSLGLLFARPDAGFMPVITNSSPVGGLTRKLLLLPILILPLIGWYIARAERFQLQAPAFSASLIITGAMLAFFFVTWKSGIHLLGFQNQRDEALIALEQAKDSAEKANVAKSAFLANMSHEIRNPLGVMLGVAELISDPETRPTDRAKFVETMNRNGRVLMTVIDDILDLSKVEANKLAIHKHKIDLDRFTNDLMVFHQVSAKEKGLSLDMKFGVLPRCVISDEIRLRQILNNIVGNAIKFTAKGSVEIRVSSLTDKTNQQYCTLIFDVIDTGPGIQRDHLYHLFEPFSQGDNSKTRQFGGTGLGLALARKLARLLNGDIQYVPLNKGSLFRTQIQAETVFETENTVDYREENVPIIQTGRLKGMKILIADDTPDNRTLIERILSLEGAVTSLAVDGKDAIEKTREFQPDAILMDIQMPNMDGLAATRKLRESGFDKPIIAVSAHAMAEDYETSKAAGANEHVTKPINREKLILTLSKCA